MAPTYKHHIFICQNQRPEGHPRGCCMTKGSDKILIYMKTRIIELGLKNIRVNKAGCPDQCEKGPAVVIYPEGAWYTIKTIEEAETLIQDHLIKEQKATGLLME